MLTTTPLPQSLRAAERGLALLLEARGDAGHWITIKQKGAVAHIFIGGGGRVLKGPEHLLGANIAHLPPISGQRDVEHHPAGHEPPGAQEHPAYAERQMPEPLSKDAAQEGLQKALNNEPGTQHTDADRETARAGLTKAADIYHHAMRADVGKTGQAHAQAMRAAFRQAVDHPALSPAHKVAAESLLAAARGRHAEHMEHPAWKSALASFEKATHAGEATTTGPATLPQTEIGARQRLAPPQESGTALEPYRPSAHKEQTADTLQGRQPMPQTLPQTTVGAAQRLTAPDKPSIADMLAERKSEREGEREAETAKERLRTAATAHRKAYDEHASRPTAETQAALAQTRGTLQRAVDHPALAPDARAAGQRLLSQLRASHIAQVNARASGASREPEAGKETPDAADTIPAGMHQVIHDAAVREHAQQAERYTMARSERDKQHAAGNAAGVAHAQAAMDDAQEKMRTQLSLQIKHHPSARPAADIKALPKAPPKAPEAAPAARQAGASTANLSGQNASILNAHYRRTFGKEPPAGASKQDIADAIAGKKEEAPPAPAGTSTAPAALPKGVTLWGGMASSIGAGDDLVGSNKYRVVKVSNRLLKSARFAVKRREPSGIESLVKDGMHADVDAANAHLLRLHQEAVEKKAAPPPAPSLRPGGIGGLQDAATEPEPKAPPQTAPKAPPFRAASTSPAEGGAAHDAGDVQELHLGYTPGVGHFVRDKKTGERVSAFHTNKKDAQYLLEDYKRDVARGERKKKSESYLINP